MTSVDRTEAKYSSAARVFEILTLLPSESSIHFLVYCSLVLLALSLVIAVPAIVLFFAEHRPGTGVFFVAVNLTVFLAVFVAHLRRNLGVPRPHYWEARARSIVRFLRRFPAARGLARRIGTRLTPTYLPFPDLGGRNAFREFYDECWKTASGGMTSTPPLYWTYQDSRALARVAGRSRSPVVAISAGLVSLVPGDKAVAEVYLLHEFGHILNRDLEVFALALSALSACSSVMLVSSVLSAFFLLPFFNGEVWGALILLVSVMWLLSLSFLWLLLARYGGVVISLRELYADVRAVLGLGNLGSYEALLAYQAASKFYRFWHKLRSLVSLRLIHLSPSERLAFLNNPESLLFPRHRYYVLAGSLLAVLQSNPFGEGYDNSWMRWPFLVVWAPVCLAYLMNVGRAIEGVSCLQNKPHPQAFTSLWLGVTAILFLPMFRFPGLYGDLVLSIGNWGAFWSGIEDSIKSIYAEWAHIQFLAVPIMTLVWLRLTQWLAVRRMSRVNPEELKETIVRCDRSFFVYSLVAVLAETLLMAVEQYGGTGPTVLDQWQLALLKFRAAPPLLAMSILMIGSFWVWRHPHPRGTSPDPVG